MALQLATSFKGISLSAAYLRILSYIVDRDAGTVAVRYGVWQSAADAVVILPSRETLDQAEAELQVFMSTRTEESNYLVGLDVRKRRIDDLERAYQEGITTVGLKLEMHTKLFPYDPDFTVTKGYLLLKTLPEIVGAIDV